MLLSLLGRGEGGKRGGEAQVLVPLGDDTELDTLYNLLCSMPHSVSAVITPIA